MVDAPDRATPRLFGDTKQKFRRFIWFHSIVCWKRKGEWPPTNHQKHLRESRAAVLALRGEEAPIVMVMRAFTKRRSSNEKPASSSDWYIKQFEVYYDADENQICPEGIEKLCTALGVEPSDVLILVLAWVLEAQQMGYITRDEWAAGQSALGDAASPEGLLDELKSVYAATRKNREQLRNLHRYTHKFCRDDRKKNIDVAVAIPMLTLLHGPAFSGHVPNLCGFLEVCAAPAAPPFFTRRLFFFARLCGHVPSYPHALTRCLCVCVCVCVCVCARALVPVVAEARHRQQTWGVC